MSFEQLVEYENFIGFNSFGKLADLTYGEVAKYQGYYKNIEEIKNAIAQYPDYRQLIEEQGEDGLEYSLETKFSDFSYTNFNIVSFSISNSSCAIFCNSCAEILLIFSIIFSCVSIEFKCKTDFAAARI